LSPTSVNKLDEKVYLKQKVDKNASARKNISCQKCKLLRITPFNALPSTPKDMM
jgi:hypothetical protein